MSAAPQLVSGYVEAVVQRLRDLPATEQAEIEADLRRHLLDIGCRTGSECVARLGTPEEYAAGLREGMGLGEYRRPPRRVPVRVIAAVGVLAAAVAAMVVLRDDPLPEAFSPLSTGSSMIEGVAADTFGTGVQLVVDRGGAARFAIVVSNDSDETLRVRSVTVPFALFRQNGSGVTGGVPIATTDPTDVVMTDIWDPEIRIAHVADRDMVSIGPHEQTGDPAGPFAWRPGETYIISVAGDVSPCEPGWGHLDGVGVTIEIDYAVGDIGVGAALAAISIDAEACT